MGGERARLASREARLVELEAMCRLAPVGLCFVDRELRFRHVNEHFAALTGRSVADHIGRNVTEIVPQLADQVTTGFERLLSTGEAQRGVELIGRLPSDPGCLRSWLVDHHPIRDERGRVCGVVTVVVDVTARKASERGLALARERLAAAQRVAGVGSWEWDILRDRVWWSDELYRLFRKDKGAFIPSLDSFYETIHPDDRMAFRGQLDATLQRDAPYVLEFRVLLDDGDMRVFHTSAAMERTPEGLPARLIGTVQDITESRRAEEERARAAQR
jgi:two-component system sensor histidine kinase/response regulator